MDAIITYLLETASWVVLVGVAIWVAWKLSKYHTELEHAKKKVSELPCETRRNEIETALSYKESMDRLTSRLESVASQLDDVCKWVMKQDISTVDTFAPKHSPRQMNAMGLDLFEKSSAKKTVEDNLQMLLEQLQAKNPQTCYDVEDCALEVLIANLSHPMMNDIKNYLYFNPSYIVSTDEEGKEVKSELSMSLLLHLMSIELRDRYIELHPELK